MSTLLIKTSVSKEVEKKIILPSFWKWEHKFLAVPDAKTCIKLFVSADGEYIGIMHGHPDTFNNDIGEADANWEHITEQEFLSAYDDAHESIRMKPLLIDTGSDQAYTEFMKTQNF